MFPAVPPKRTSVSVFASICMLLFALIFSCGLFTTLAYIGSPSQLKSINTQSVGVQGTTNMIVALALLLVYLIVGLGLFQMRRWAYSAAIIVNVIFFGLGLLVLLGSRVLDPSALIYLLFSMPLALTVLLLLLVSQKTREAFGFTVKMASKRTSLLSIVAFYMVVVGLIGILLSFLTLSVPTNYSSRSLGQTTGSSSISSVTNVQLSTQILSFGLPLLIGVIFLITGIGLLRIRKWAYSAAIAINLIYGFITGFGVLSLKPFSAGGLLVPALSLIAFFVLLFSERTKALFV